MSNNIQVYKGQIEKMAPEFKKALPGHISPERFVRTAQTAIALTRNIEKLQNHGSLMAACTKAAADGLIIDGREAAIVIDYRGNADYRPMVRGLLKLMYNTGAVKSILVEVVRENDYFDYSPTDYENPIKHKIDMRTPRGEAYAVYALAILKDGGILYEVMTTEDINRIRDRSDAWKAFEKGKIKSTPWATDWSEMARKTVLRRLYKYMPSSVEDERLQNAVEREDVEYSFEMEGTTDEATPTNAGPRKAGAGNDILSQVDDTPAEEVIDAEFVDHDPETGEVVDEQAPEAETGDEGKQEDDDI